MCPDDTGQIQVSITSRLINVGTPLYLLTLQVPAFSDGDDEYPNAWLALLRTSTPYHQYNFRGLLLEYTPGMEQECGALFLMYECFTLEEVELIRAYFGRHPWQGATLIEECG